MELGKISYKSVELEGEQYSIQFEYVSLSAYFTKKRPHAMILDAWYQTRVFWIAEQTRIGAGLSIWWDAHRLYTFVVRRGRVQAINQRLEATSLNRNRHTGGERGLESEGNMLQ